MTTKISDLLIELSDPIRYAEFEQNPEEFVGQFDLSPGEKTAFLTRELGDIRGVANSVDNDDLNQQFNRATMMSSILPTVEITHGVEQLPTVEITHGIEQLPTVEITHNVTGSNVMLFIDGNGTYYRAVRDN